MPKIDWEGSLASCVEDDVGGSIVVVTGGSGRTGFPPCRRADTGPGNAEESDIDRRFAFFNKSLDFLAGKDIPRLGVGAPEWPLLSASALQLEAAK